jgi:hypothetical protein
MKDYNHRGSRQESQNWVDKIIDKETLVGKKERIPSGLLGLFQDADNQINDLLGNTRNDTGLYELYVNVVAKFVDNMIKEAERYAGISHNFLGIGEELPKDNWVARTGQGPGQHGNPAGMSYSYGGIMNINMFNQAASGVSLWKAAPNDAYPKQPNEDDTHYYARVLQYYRGNVNDNTGGINEAGYQNKWAGLKWLKNNEYKKWEEAYKSEDCPGNTASDNAVFAANVRNHPYYPLYWAGIDCAAFVQRVINAADPAVNTSITNLTGVNTTIWDLNQYVIQGETCHKDNQNNVTRDQPNRAYTVRIPV